MKKILVSLFLLVTLFSCSSIFKKNDDVSTKVSKEDMKQQKIEDKKQKDFVKKMASYELEATISTTTGSAGYTMKDEIADWVDFTDPGMLAMANSGPNTNGSQFFLTMNVLTQLDGQYTIFGELKTREDLSILKLIRQDDKIISIQIKGRKVDEFLGNFTDIINSWNR